MKLKNQAIMPNCIYHFTSCYLFFFQVSSLICSFYRKLYKLEQTLQKFELCSFFSKIKRIYSRNFLFYKPIRRYWSLRILIQEINHLKVKTSSAQFYTRCKKTWLLWVWRHVDRSTLSKLSKSNFEFRNEGSFQIFYFILYLQWIWSKNSITLLMRIIIIW